MQAVVLAGGLGTRIAEESAMRPKPMIEIGGRPILWHIMKIYAQYGITEFVICVGYKGYMIKEYFANYVMQSSDVTIDTGNGSIKYHAGSPEKWRITIADTGHDTMTGGRLKRIRHFLNPSEPFCMTYGDGLANLNIASLVSFHKQHGKQATLTAVVPPGRYGALQLSGDAVDRFAEKPPGDNGLVNGGFFVLAPTVLDRIEGDATNWEREPLEGLAQDQQLMAFQHVGFWQPMDTLRDKQKLEDLWQTRQAPWKTW